MNSKNNQETLNTSLMQDIQNEVSQESAPLLQFITRNAPLIAGFTLALLLILGVWGAWGWYQGSKLDEARAELALINMRLNGEERDKALEKLAETAPAGLKLFAYMSLGKSAQENGNSTLAADAYAKAASLDGDGALGLTAAIGSAGSLLMQGKYKEAMELLQQLESKYPEAAKSPHMGAMLAEAAYRAGDLSLAQKTYEGLANSSQTSDAAYFRSRAESLAEQIGAGNSAPETTNNAVEEKK